MSRLSKYKKIDPAHLALLKAREIKTVDDLWDKVGHKSEGMERLAGDVGLTPGQLLTILAACAKPEPRSDAKRDRFTFWFSNYWREALAFLIAGVLIALLAVNALWLRDTVVVSAAGLPAYHVIKETEVKVEKRLGTYGSFATTDKVSGRYLLKPAESGDVLSSEHLGPALPEGVSLDGRRLLSLPVRGGLIGQTLAPHDRVRLIFSPRSPEAQTAASLGDRSVNDAVVLAVDRQGDASSVVVAVKDDDLAKAALLLGTSDVFITQSVPQ